MSKKLIQAAAGAAGEESVYVDDVFSTYLYEGNGSTQTITNGIDLSGEGGLIWTKARSSSSLYHTLRDTERGTLKYLQSNAADAEGTNNAGTNIYQVNSDGYELGLGAQVNGSGNDYVSWSFRKQAGFFDVVTYTGNGDSSLGAGDGSTQTISHNLGSAPGLIIVKDTGNSSDWIVFHRSLGSTHYIKLNTTGAGVDFDGYWNDTDPTSTEFTVGTHYYVNGSGNNFVAYLFAHDDQSFGDGSDESIIKCGSFTNDSASVGVEVNLGWEPQWLLIKGASSGSGLGNWALIDNMRGASVDSQQRLYANSSGAEGSSNWFKFTSRGFTPNTYFDGTLIYIAIRRPMKTPEAGTEVFKPVAQTGGSFVTTGFPVDLLWHKWDLAGQPFWWNDRIRGAGFKFLRSDGTDQEDSYSTNYMPMDYNNGVEDDWNSSGDQAYFAFRRATGFFDTVCYVADQTSSHNHNLGVTPEFAIIKQRNGTNGWKAYHSYLGNNQYLQPHTTNAAATDTGWASVNASTFFLKANNGNNIAYLWATVDGVSKVGSVVHSGTTNVDCGFSAGARFVLIKRTDSTGGWYVYDSARGIVAGNDPYYLLDDTAVEVTNTDYIDPLNAGFTLTSSFTAGTYIFLAIA